MDNISRYKISINIQCFYLSVNTGAILTLNLAVVHELKSINVANME